MFSVPRGEFAGSLGDGVNTEERANVKQRGLVSAKTVIDDFFDLADNPSEKPEHPMSFSYKSKFLETQSDYLSSVKAHGRASVNLFIASASASIDFNKSKSDMKNAVNMQSECGVEYGVQRLADESLEMSPQALDFLQKNGRDAFQRKYGNYFCYAKTVGASHNSVITMRVREQASAEGMRVVARIKILFVRKTFKKEWQKDSYHKTADYEKIEVYTLDLPNSTTREGKNINLYNRDPNSKEPDVARIIQDVASRSDNLSDEVGARWGNYPGPPVVRYYFMPYYFLANYNENAETRATAPQPTVLWQASPDDPVYDTLKEYISQFEGVQAKISEYNAAKPSQSWLVVKTEVEGVIKRLRRMAAAVPPISPLEDASVPTPCEMLVRLEMMRLDPAATA